MRSLHVSTITETIREMCIEANHFLTKDMGDSLSCAACNEESPLGRRILEQLQENLKIAGEDTVSYTHLTLPTKA